MSDTDSRRIYAGPAVLSYGFRPFFLAGALWAMVSVMLWLPQYFGELTLNMAFQPLDWHAHEALFGYVAAIVTGFLLTAAPNWTGRAPLQGRPLLFLLAVWLAGRAAIAFSAHIGWVAAAMIDCAFLVLVCAAVGREILAGKNGRNLKVLIFVGLLLAANVVFHVEAHFAGSATYGRRFGVAATLALVMLIGGRIIPSFTHTFLKQRGQGRLPTTFKRFDGFCMAGSVAALMGWVLAPDSKIVGLLLIAAGLLNLFRLARWAGERTSGEALVLILHLAYLFVPLGFVLSGLAPWTGIPLSAGLHAWAVGAIGVMTMAVMTRSSLGHTGQALHAGKGAQAIYAAVLLAAAARIAAALAPQWSFALLHLAAFAWAFAFLGFAMAFGGALLRPRKS
ncbi:NnrS family protein [uncultured Rhodoblastus sp.]|uniref:NnrS family protein n=1 Tax=uncultured Rhodoblastus sp. TaxID=543037 RepID=UPI0025D34A98|nr:NnrS family protein [uncultured Rhodoblastus sp.]